MIKETQENEFKALIATALSECKKALDVGDIATAEFFKAEAFDLLSQLPENAPYMRTLQ